MAEKREAHVRLTREDIRYCRNAIQTSHGKKLTPQDIGVLALTMSIITPIEVEYQQIADFLFPGF